MPRLPVDGKKVIEYRVTLGQKERDQLDTLITGITVRNVGDPVIKLLSDGTALAAIFVGLSVLYPKWADALPEGWEDTTAGMTVNQIIDWVNNIEDLASGPSAILAVVGAVIGGVSGGPLGAIGVGAAGAAAGEGIEEVYTNRNALWYTLMLLGARAARTLGVD